MTWIHLLILIRARGVYATQTRRSPFNSQETRASNTWVLPGYLRPSSSYFVRNCLAAKTVRHLQRTSSMEGIDDFAPKLALAKGSSLFSVLVCCSAISSNDRLPIRIVCRMSSTCTSKEIGHRQTARAVIRNPKPLHGHGEHAAPRCHSV